MITESERAELAALQMDAAVEQVAWAALARRVEEEAKATEEFAGYLSALVDNNGERFDQLVGELSRMSLGHEDLGRLTAGMETKAIAWVARFTDKVESLEHALERLVPVPKIAVDVMENETEALRSTLESAADRLSGELTGMVTETLTSLDDDVATYKDDVAEALEAFAENVKAASIAATGEIKAALDDNMEAVEADASAFEADIEAATDDLYAELQSTLDALTASFNDAREDAKATIRSLKDSYADFVAAMVAAQEAMNAAGTGMSAGSEAVHTAKEALDAVG